MFLYETKQSAGQHGGGVQMSKGGGGGRVGQVVGGDVDGLHRLPDSGIPRRPPAPAWC